MANLVSYIPFNLNDIDLHWYVAYADDSLLERNANIFFNGQTYPDLFWADGWDGYDYLELVFLGSGITEDSAGNIISGTVNVVGEFDLNQDALLWYVEGVSTSAVAIYNAALTPSNGDEINLVQAALAGNDTITLSPFSDVMSGFGGNDTITGGLGADVLSGGSGSDTFLDTAAGLNGDTITDFTASDRIVITNASLNGFTFSVSGNVLTYSGGSLTLSSIPAGQFVATAAAGGGVQLAIGAAVAADALNDFNGDGRSDVLWRNNDGVITNWLGQANGGFAANHAIATGVPLDWAVVGTGDFNGDGRDDILWRNTAGVVTDWLGQASGGFVGNHANAATGVPLDWAIAGTGDFNGDGRDDILWRNDAGVVTNWLGQANGGFVGNHANAAIQVPLDWTIAGTGDFNGDGRSDVLWRNANGVVSNWLGQANGAFAANHANAATGVPLDWTVVGTGDFNGDGRDDVLWRNDNGTVINWLGQPNGGFVSNQANSATTVSLDWHVAGVGDYNGDGRDDVLWRNDAGVVTNWLGQTNGGFIGNHANAATAVPLDWHVQLGWSGSGEWDY